jgi:predicted outer membrane protein
MRQGTWAALLAAAVMTGTAAGVGAQDTVRLSQTAREGRTPPPKPNRLTDANILAVLAVRNAAEIEAGLIASQKGSTPQVRAYGMMLVRDHRRAMAEGNALAARLGVTPESPAGYAAPAPPADASALLSKRSLEAERVNESAKARDPQAEAKTYKDQVRGTDVQGQHAVHTPPPPPNVVREPGTSPGLALKWLPGDTTSSRLPDDPVAASHAAAMLKLQALSGAEFDRAFAEYAVIAHEGVLNEVQSMLLPDADHARLKAMLEKKQISLINHRRGAERLLMHH